MTSDFLQAITWIFTSAWKLLTAFTFPGTNVTPASMLLFGAAATVGFRFLTNLFGFSDTVSIREKGNQRLADRFDKDA